MKILKIKNCFMCPNQRNNEDLPSDEELQNSDFKKQQYWCIATVPIENSVHFFDDTSEMAGIPAWCPLEDCGCYRSDD